MTALHAIADVGAIAPDRELYPWEVSALRTAHRKVPMPEWPGPGSCRWCLKPTVWESGKRTGQPAPHRNWHNGCYSLFRLHTEPAAQYDFLFGRDGPFCRECRNGGFAPGMELADRPPGMSWERFFEADKTDFPRYTILKARIILEVDHIEPLWRIALTVPLAERRRYFGPDNLQLLCTPCHKAKSKREAAERAEMKRALAA